jgi:hypothetical protein
VGSTGSRNISAYGGVTNLADTRGIRRKIVSCTLSTTYAAGNPGLADVAFCTLDLAFAALVAFAPATTQTFSKITVKNDFAPTPVNGTRCKVAGWGSYSMVNLGTGHYTNYLQELPVTLLDIPSCQRMWPKQVYVSLFSSSNEFNSKFHKPAESRCLH